jgi:integrase/recombinase XerD
VGDAAQPESDSLAAATPLAAAVRTYLDHLSVERGLAPNSLSSYRRDLRRYLAFAADRGIGTPDAISASTITDFLVGLREGSVDHPPLSSASAARAIVAVRGFHKFAAREGLAGDDLFPREARLSDVYRARRAAE